MFLKIINEIKFANSEINELYCRMRFCTTSEI